MSVIDLSTRISDDWEKFDSNKTSSDSYVFISPNTYRLDDGPASVDLTVGERWFLQHNESAYPIDSDGMVLKPFQSMLIETAQRLALPYNVFGIVTGKGLQIFQGSFISTGKINPGFIGQLRIGIYNGSKEKIILKPGDQICTCVFLEMESNLTSSIIEKPDKTVKPIPIKALLRFKFFWKDNKDWITPLVAFLALIIAGCNIFLNKNFIFNNNPKSETKSEIKK